MHWKIWKSSGNKILLNNDGPIVCKSGFHPGFFNWGGSSSLASQILYLTTTLGKSLTRPFPAVAIKQRVWSARLGFSRSSMQRDLSHHSAPHLHYWKGGGGGGGRDFGSLQGWADPENLEGWDLIEAKANILNKNFEILKKIKN